MAFKIHITSSKSLVTKYSQCNSSLIFHYFTTPTVHILEMTVVSSLD